MTHPSPVITPEMFEILARRQSPCFESVRDYLVKKLAEPAWHPTTTIHNRHGDLCQLWVCQELRLGDFVPTVLDSQWRVIPTPNCRDDIATSRIDAAEKCIHRIEDAFEYRMDGMDQPAIKAIIMGFIEDYTDELSIDSRVMTAADSSPDPAE